MNDYKTNAGNLRSIITNKINVCSLTEVKYGLGTRIKFSGDLAFSYLLARALVGDGR